jgi:hypothetical protein
MSLTIKATGGSDFELAPEGTYIARCFKIIDLGTQSTEWKGETKHRPKVLISWELLDPEAHMSDGQPFAVSKRYTASLNEKADLRKDLQAWRGKRFTDDELAGFDLKNVLGAYCQIQITHDEGNNGTTYANIDAIMSTREKPEPVNKAVYFDIHEPDLELFESFSERLKEQIQQSPEWQQRGKKNAPADTDVDMSKPVDLSEIPF